MRNYVTLKKTTDYFGKVFASNNCGFYQIILANNTNRMKAVFITTNTEVWVTASQVDTGSVVDPYSPSVKGVGFHGDVESTVDSNGKQLKEYVLWYCMLDRCYGDRELKAYEDCIVSDSFHNFSNFQKWFHQQVGCCAKDYELDKDILSDGCKIYAEDTCVLVPKIINSFFIKHNNKKTKSDLPSGVNYVPENTSKPFRAKYNGHGGEKLEAYFDNEWEAFLAYKRAKEARAKELAKEYYGLIDQRIYDKLMSYKVLLTD